MDGLVVYLLKPNLLSLFRKFVLNDTLLLLWTSPLGVVKLRIEAAGSK